MKAKAERTALQGALLLDFTGCCPGFRSMSCVNQEFIDLIRNSGSEKKLAVIVDTAFGSRINRTMVVRDHLNWTGTNPLVGPNHPAGVRFPVVQGVYDTDTFAAVPAAVAVGIKPQLSLSATDIAVIHDFGGDFACFNLVPAMLVLAHAGWKLIGLAIPDGQEMDTPVREQLNLLVGEGNEATDS